MEKRVIFKGWWLPFILVAPQLIVTAIFFFYPAGQAVWNSLFLPDPFGLKTEFVGLDNFKFLATDSYYRASFITTIIFSTNQRRRCLSNFINMALCSCTCCCCSYLEFFIFK